MLQYEEYACEGKVMVHDGSRKIRRDGKH